MCLDNFTQIARFCYQAGGVSLGRMLDLIGLEEGEPEERRFFAFLTEMQILRQEETPTEVRAATEAFKADEISGAEVVEVQREHAALKAGSLGRIYGEFLRDLRNSGFDTSLIEASVEDECAGTIVFTTGGPDFELMNRIDTGFRDALDNALRGLDR